MEELELQQDDAVLIIRADNTIELLVEDDDDEFAPQNKQIILAISYKLQHDPDWIEALFNSIDKIVHKQVH
jgi:hypothetical protein